MKPHNSNFNYLKVLSTRFTNKGELLVHVVRLLVSLEIAFGVETILADITGEEFHVLPRVTDFCQLILINL